VARRQPAGSTAEASTQYAIRHASGGWFNYRVTGLLVDDPKHATVWTSRALVDAVAAMLRADNGYEVVPLPA